MADKWLKFAITFCDDEKIKIIRAHEAWRKENHKEWCTPAGNFGLKLENPVDTLPEV